MVVSTLRTSRAKYVNLILTPLDVSKGGKIVARIVVISDDQPVIPKRIETNDKWLRSWRLMEPILDSNTLSRNIKLHKSSQIIISFGDIFILEVPDYKSTMLIYSYVMRSMKRVHKSAKLILQENEKTKFRSK